MQKKVRLFKSLYPCRIVFAFLIVILFSHKSFGEPETLRVHFMDVGYGDAILIELPDQSSLMIDAGEAQYSSQIIAYLKERGIKEIDATILTHPHDNHFGGLADIIDRFPIHRFYFNDDDQRAEEGYSEVIEKLKRRAVPMTVVRRGDEILVGTKDVRIQILHPADLSGSTNQNSVVTWLTFGETSFLFTADIKKSQQKEIMALFPEIQSADCVQVPHHGGKISRKFAEFLGNKIFVISTGENEYEKPYEQELEKLEGEIFRTDQHGAIVLESDGSTVRLLREKIP